MSLQLEKLLERLEAEQQHMDGMLKQVGWCVCNCSPHSRYVLVWMYFDKAGRFDTCNHSFAQTDVCKRCPMQVGRRWYKPASGVYWVLAFDCCF